MINALQQLADTGVAVWLDDLSRTQIKSGKLAELAAHGGVVGVTTNPTIFAKALRTSQAVRSRTVSLTAVPLSARSCTCSS